MALEPHRGPITLLALLLATGCPKGNPIDTAETEGPVTMEHCGTIEGEETWSADVGHLITCDVVVEGTLTVEPGVEVYAEQGTALRVQGGTINATGDQNTQLLFASAEGFPVAGDWVGITGTDGDVNLTYVTVRHAGSEGALVALSGGTAALSGLILSNSTDKGLYAEGTEFSVLEEIEVAYAEEPITIPWPAGEILSGVYLDQVDGAAVRLLGDRLATPVGLGPINVPWLAEGVTVVDGGVLWVEEGAILAVTGDITVQEGGSIVMRGVSGNTAALLGWEGTEFSVSIERDATLADFRWASIAGGGIVSDALDLSFRYTELTGAPGVGLDITGNVDSSVYSQLDGCSFEGAGYGLVVPLWLLPVVGDNDYSGAAFDGIVVSGGTIERDVNLEGWPADAVLVDGELVLSSGATSLNGAGTLQFVDGGGLMIDGAQFHAGGVTFTHQGATPGGWEGISVGATGLEVSFDDIVVAYGGGWDGANLTLGRSATVQGSTFRDSAGWGILIDEGVEADLSGNTYRDNAQGDVGP